MAGLMPDGRPRPQSPQARGGQQQQQQLLHPEQASPPQRPLLIPQPSPPLPRTPSPRPVSHQPSSSSSEGHSLSLMGRRPLQRQQPVDCSTESLVGKFIAEEGLQSFVDPTLLRREIQESMDMTDDEMDRAIQQLFQSPAPSPIGSAHSSMTPSPRPPASPAPYRHPRPVSPCLRSASSPTPNTSPRLLRQPAMPNFRSNSGPTHPLQSTQRPPFCEHLGGFAMHEIQDFTKYSPKNSGKPQDSSSRQWTEDSEENMIYVTTL